MITSHHTASNGLVEHTNSKILEILRHLAGYLQETWEDWLFHVAASINCSVSSSTGKTLHYILCGVDERLPYDVLVPPLVPLFSLDDYSKLHLLCFQAIDNSFREKFKASREEMIRKKLFLATPVHLDVGDSLMKRAPDLSCELIPKFSGPYLLTVRLHCNAYKLLDPSTNISEILHVDRLKKVSAFFTLISY